MSIRLFSFAMLLLPLSLQAQTSPEEFLGHQVGADRTLVDYHQIRAYFEQLDEESGKVSVLTIGETTLGEPMIMAVVTSEDNMANLDRYREIGRHPGGPRGAPPGRAAASRARGPTPDGLAPHRTSRGRPRKASPPPRTARQKTERSTRSLARGGNGT